MFYFDIHVPTRMNPIDPVTQQTILLQHLVPLIISLTVLVVCFNPLMSCFTYGLKLVYIMPLVTNVLYLYHEETSQPFFKKTNKQNIYSSCEKMQKKTFSVKMS